ncbi:MFS transporter [uncultured Megasphaera sp.]|uniref:MFS transporter n=1 Tax=uncultured Megasphaera sp. TaxID=165188 RepID=UPI00286949A4|nr:MFS transporter [uncultured Megasphaera sp.]
MFRSIPLKYVLPLLGLTVSAFIFNTSEFMPIGLLIDISQSFSMTESQTGIMITVYAWVVALLSLPLMLLVCRMELRRLLLLTMGLFSLGQLLSGIALNFPMLMAARICVACAHSIFWSIAAPMATRLVTRTHRPMALSMIVTGSAVAMIFGLPLGRVIGLYAGWRMTFLAITAVSLAVLLYLAFVFPRLASDSSFSRDDLPKLLKNPLVVSVYVLSVLFATAYFTVYSYIEPFLKNVAAFSDQGITSTLMLLGVSGLLGSYLFSHFYNHFRYGVIRAGFVGLVAMLLLWQSAAAGKGTMVAACLLIGCASTLFNVTFQAELIRHVSMGAAPVAMSIFSGIFNVGIGGGTWIGGRVTAHGLLPYIGYAGVVIGLTALVYCFVVYFHFLRKSLKKDEEIS